MYYVVNMFNVRTNVYFDQEYYYILSLMLIHEAIKTDNDELRLVAAIEAAQTIILARYTFYSGKIFKEITKQITKQTWEYATKHARKQATKNAGEKRHEKGRELKKYAQRLARGLHNKQTTLDAQKIRDAIRSDVNKKAGKNKDGKDIVVADTTLYKWVLDALK